MIIRHCKRDSEMIPDGVRTMTYEFAINVATFRQQPDRLSAFRQYSNSHPRLECHPVYLRRLICFMINGKKSKWQQMLKAESLLLLKQTN